MATFALVVLIALELFGLLGAISALTGDAQEIKVGTGIAILSAVLFVVQVPLMFILAMSSSWSTAMPLTWVMVGLGTVLFVKSLITQVGRTFRPTRWYGLSRTVLAVAYVFAYMAIYFI